MTLQQLMGIIPELHLHQTELLQVCTQFKGPKYGVFLSQHDQRGAGQAAVDVQAEPDPKILKLCEEVVVEAKREGGGKRVREGTGRIRCADERRAFNVETNVQPFSCFICTCFACGVVCQL